MFPKSNKDFWVNLFLVSNKASDIDVYSEYNSKLNEKFYSEFKHPELSIIMTNVNTIAPTSSLSKQT